MYRFYYFDVSLELEQDTTEISAVYFKNHVMHLLNILFGEDGASTAVDVLKYDELSRRAILRCPSASYVKLRSSLTLCEKFNNIRCVYRIRNSSPCLLSLLNTSRGYNHY
ncbi:ribonuclease P protein subunit p14-like isoform X3 [Zootermopsis nevadensis]|uniref:ribonuclease P protein subunit p14-like isoform X2 n=1 Tax=Zootermopsis nevadensis TaxID=136037 RepID=UPI000B8ED6A2|nr:ribonuclease P protein subunit p14-like isoform X2 [Zootermopsis nevadensis]XP_021930816.1 ribonuclease P protein subunit p14-like isoform X3 [Zootermopsis nevadensis]